MVSSFSIIALSAPSLRLRNSLNSCIFSDSRTWRRWRAVMIYRERSIVGNTNLLLREFCADLIWIGAGLSGW
jgi:hypothetical protein